MKDGIKSSTIKAGEGYRGRITVYSDGHRCYCLTSKILCISRGDALRAAMIMAHDLVIERFDEGSTIYSKPGEG